MNNRSRRSVLLRHAALTIALPVLTSLMFVEPAAAHPQRASAICGSIGEWETPECGEYPHAHPDEHPPEATPDNWRGAASLSGDLADTAPSEYGAASSGDSGNSVTGRWNNGAACPGYPSD